MSGKILRYHEDHNASREEAGVIASYYLNTAAIFRDIKTQEDVEKLLESIEVLTPD
jgi:hypothetical protein